MADVNSASASTKACRWAATGEGIDASIMAAHEAMKAARTQVCP
jgi:hypothetical protein